VRACVRAYMCVSVCLCVCVREREREREKTKNRPDCWSQRVRFSRLCCLRVVVRTHVHAHDDSIYRFSFAHLFASARAFGQIRSSRLALTSAFFSYFLLFTWCRPRFFRRRQEVHWMHSARALVAVPWRRF
jgi:hypothetical protein